MIKLELRKLRNSTDCKGSTNGTVFTEGKAPTRFQLPLHSLEPVLHVEVQEVLGSVLFSQLCNSTSNQRTQSTCKIMYPAELKELGVNFVVRKGFLRR